MLMSYGQIGQAVQDWQKTAIDLSQRFMTRFGNAPQSLSRCTSLTELAQWQRDIYSDVINEAVAANHAILQTLSKVTENALRALEPHPIRGPV